MWSVVIRSSHPIRRIRQRLENSPGLFHIAHIRVPFDQEIRDIRCHVNTSLDHLRDIDRQEVRAFMRDDDVDDGFKDNGVRRGCPGVLLDRVEDGDGLVKVLRDTAVRIDERGEVGAGDLDTDVFLKLLENAFHFVELDGFDRSIGIHKQLF